jgi:flagellar biosynthesis protein FliQ
VFVPKILAMVATTIALLSWITVKMMEFSTEMFTWSPATGA